MTNMLRPLAAPALVLAGFAAAARAQPAAPSALNTPAFEAPVPAQGVLTPPQLDQIVAPVALYPDPLLTDILAAATNPAQVVEAQRFLAAHPGLQGAALTDATATRDWDPSVQALLPFPQILQMMDGHLEWTDRLGHAFIAQQADVLNAIQRLRQDAQRAGTLRNGPQDNVVNDGGTIVIEPPSPQQVYVPTYDAGCVYGPAVFADSACGGGYAIGWDGGVFLPYGYLQWGFVDWGGRNIRYAHGGFGRGGFGTFSVGSDVWRPRAHPHLTGFGGFGGSPEHFLYAPPATAWLPRSEGGVRGAAPVHANVPPGATRGRSFAPAPHAPAVVHAAVGGFGRR
jgi:hypothetical protein